LSLFSLFKEGSDGALKESEIPAGERNYFLSGRSDVFEQDGKFYIFMGKFFGWEEAEKIHIFPNGTVSALSGFLNEAAVVTTAGRILKEGRVIFDS
jgi:hypothetical protein